MPEIEVLLTEEGAEEFIEAEMSLSAFDDSPADVDLGEAAVAAAPVDGLRYDPALGWRLYIGGRFASDYTGLWFDPNLGWWLVRGGAIAFDYTGLWLDPNLGWWLIGNGAIAFDYNGLWLDPNLGWWLVRGGAIAFDYSGPWDDPDLGKCEISGGTVVDANSTELIFALATWLEDTVAGEMALAFKARVEALTGGSVTVTILPNGVMGSESTVLRSILGGGETIDIACLSTATLSQVGRDKGGLLALPYTFKDDARFWKFATGDLARDFLAESQASGLPWQGLCYGMEGLRHFFFNKKVNGISDLKGLKIRVTDDPVMAGMVSALGGVATAVSFGELYTALQAGVVDAAEQPITNYLSNSFQEVAPYLLLDGHTADSFEFIITDSALSKLSNSQRRIVMAAGEYAAAAGQAKQAALESDALARLRKYGAAIVSVADKTPWRNACAGVINANLGSNAAAYQSLLALAN